MLLAFTAIVLAGAVVPLTLSTIGQDRNSFIQDTRAMANADASVAQKRVVSRKPAAARPVDFDLLFVYKQVEQAGDGLVIYLHQRPLAGRQGPAAGPVAAVGRPGGRRPVRPVTGTTGSRGDRRPFPSSTRARSPGPVLGTVILTRSTAPLDREIVALWVLFGTICAVAMIGAALLAFGLARWVSGR